MNQVIPFNQSKAGKEKNMCLKNVRLGYGIAPRYDTAWQAWQNTEQHTGTPPAGLDVPVYFSYTATIDGKRANYGHIGVRLANGKFWSDGVTYSSISAYTKNHAPKYVGWGESINAVKVIKENDMYKGKSAKKHYEEAVIWKNKTMAHRKEIAELGKAIKIKDNEISKLKSQVGDNSKWETLKSLVRELIGK